MFLKELKEIGPVDATGYGILDRMFPNDVAADLNSVLSALYDIGPVSLITTITFTTI
jgi:hypothetical protein